NGYGKSSFAAAFDSLKPRSLKIHPSLLHKNDAANVAEIEIVYTDAGVEKTIIADESRNEISKVFSVSVITSKLKPKAVAKTGFNQYMKPTASLIVEPIVLVDRIPGRPRNRIATS